MSGADQGPVLPQGLRGAKGTHLADLFAMMSPATRDKIGKISRVKTIAAGKIMIEDGEETDHVGYVLDGMMCMTKLLQDGRKHIIGLLVPTDMYGHLFDGASSYQVEALTETQIFCLDRVPFEKILKETPEIERMFLVNVLDELDAAREWILLLGARKVIERVASFLLILIRRRSRLIGSAGLEDHPIAIHIPIRRIDLAHYLGTRPESLSRALHELDAIGVIKIHDPSHLEVMDLAALIDAAGHDLISEDSPVPG
ncbi:Crp/Fnr family transcriptional regulator [Pseudogemmobacter sp. W21_MBD1_M6]|uniref:Crp/Fnr family transcriptional regulator n=1 Tax=Pseudogemmobacter sp. W21_MBD1_M6 TaxID=3240271 RepID=UPI003F9AEE2C